MDLAEVKIDDERTLKDFVNPHDLHDIGKNIPDEEYKKWEKTVLPCERNIVRKLRHAKVTEQYDVLDLGFLRMSRKGITTLMLPRFAVFPVFKESRFGYRAFSRYDERMVLFNRRIPKCFCEHLFYACGRESLKGEGAGAARGLQYMKRHLKSFHDTPISFLSERLHGFKHEGFNVNNYINVEETSCSLEILVPGSVKKSIQEARKHFRADELFFIADMPRDAWNVATWRVTRDPLVVGIKGDVCCLIDHFEMTSVEDYVRREFTVSDG